MLEGGEKKMNSKEIEVLGDYAVWQFPLKGEVIEGKAYFARCENCDRPSCKVCLGCGASCSGEGGDNGEGGNDD